MCSLFLCLLLCLVNFSVVANAAEDENLVDNNLSNWTDYGDNSDYFVSADVTYLGESVNKITVSSSNYAVILFDLTEFLKISESYNFNFTLPTTDGANSSALESCQLSWALCDGSGDNVPTVGANVFEIIINNDNKSKYLGADITFEFTYTQGYKNTFLCLFIAPGDNSEVYEDLTLYVSNLSLERVVPESEKKLDGILGWLQDIWDKLSSIGDKLTDVWTNITASVTDLGDRISGFFSELKDNITTELTALGDRVKEFFDELPEKIFTFKINSSDIESELNSTKFIYDLSKWSTQYLGNWFQYYSDGFVHLEKGTSTKYFGFHSTESVFFPAENNCVITFDVTSSQYPTWFKVTFRSGYNSTSVNLTGNGSYEVELPFSPIDDSISISITERNDDWDNAYINLSNLVFTFTPVSSDGDSGSNNISWFEYLIGKFNKWFNGVVGSVKGFFDDLKLKIDIKIEEIKTSIHDFFVPPEGFFEEWKDKFDLMLSDNLGFIYQAPNFVIDIVEVVQEILQSDQEVNLVFPAVEFDIAGYHIELFKDTKVDFSFLEAGIWLTLYTMYKVMLYVIFALALIKYGMSTWERTMSN